MNPHVAARNQCRTAAAWVIVAAATGCGQVSDEVRDERIVLDESDVRLHGSSEALATVLDLEVLPDGRVWVLNSLDPFFVGFDAEGEVLHVHGQPGGGPEEFGAPSGFVSGGVDGEVWTYDRERHVLVEVSRPDASRSELSLPEDALPRTSLAPGIGLGLVTGSPVRTARLADELVLPRMSDPTEGGVFGYWLAVWTADLVAFDPATGAVRPLVSLGETLGDPRPHFDVSGTFVPFPLWYRLWAVCGDRIHVYDRLRNEVRAFTATGEELEPTVLPPPRYTEVGAREFAEATFPVGVVEAMGGTRGGELPEPSAADSARIFDGMLSRLDAPPDRLANLLPRYLDFRCDEEGTQWLEPFDLDGDVLDARGVWLRITRDGEVQEVRFPPRFDPYHFTAERIWGVQRDEFDVASVAWIATEAAR